MFWTRLLSGIILLLFAGYAITMGNTLLFGVTLVISLIGIRELLQVKQMEKTIVGIGAYISAILYYTLLYFGIDEKYFVYYTIGTIICMAALYVFWFQKYKTEQIMLTFFSVFYAGVMMSYVYKTRMTEHGFWFVWLIFLSSWVCDTFAYCVGMLCNKFLKTHKLAPVLSPKKSIEGAIGGVVGSTLLGTLYGYFAVSNMGAEDIGFYYIGLLCGAGAAISQIGDLFASAIKRNYGIKDYGELIPGHGGILDRFDSVIFTAPIIYFLAQMVL